MDQSPLILLPGLDGTGVLFGPLQKALGLSARTTVVRYTSERCFGDYIDTVVQALPQDNAILIAESFSGPIALALMARCPSRIRAAVLCATFATSPLRALTRAAGFAPTFAFAPGPMQSFLIRHFCLNGITDDALIQHALSVVRSVPANVMRDRLSVLAGLDMRPLLAQITTPILYLQATRDRIVSASRSRELTSALPHVSVGVVDGPHLLLQSRPLECATAIASAFERASLHRA